jgi:hypothetical protein
VILPDDPAYDLARSVWNGDIDRYPAVIARCRAVADVAAAVRFAREAGLEIAVRGGGHSYAGYSVCDGGVQINLSEMGQVAIDPETRRARCGGGATWADVDAATAPHGLAVPGGIVSHTGIGGLTLGGGMGWLTRRGGLSCDSLLSAQVVTADGRILVASADENADLFWALRGGGGNFGVVTSFEYRLHELNPLAHLGFLFWSADQGPEMLRFSRDFVRTLPDRMSYLIVGMNAPPAPFVPEEHHFALGYVLLVVGWDSAEEHQQVVKSIGATFPPLFEFITPIPHTQLQRLFNDAAQWGTGAYEKGLYFDDLSDGAGAMITEHLPKKSAPGSLVIFFPLDGAYEQVGEDDTAFGGSRRPGLAAVIGAHSPSPELLEADRGWVRSLWAALQPYAQDSGGYVNFIVEQDESRIRSSYGVRKFERLGRLKAVYDPDNLFHLNPNIKPVPASA